MDFLSELQESKERSGKSAREIAEDCGLSESAVSRYLSGRSVPPVDVARKLLDYLSDGTEAADASAAASPSGAEENDAAPDTITLPIWAYRAQMADFQKTIADLRTDHEKAMARAQRQHFAMLGLLGVLVAVIIYLVIDASHGGWGFFRYAADALQTGALL